MTEVFTYLNEISKIGNIDIDDVKELLNNESSRYVIKRESKGAILIHDSDFNKTILLKCVNNYFKYDSKDCERICESMNVSPIINCSDCLKLAINLFEEDKLNKSNNQ